MESGRTAEEAVVRYLGERGFTILKRNYRKRWGEIDLIAKRGYSVHFIEIKSRRSESGPSPVESWAREQRDRFVKLAETYLAEHPGLSEEEELEVSLDFAAVKLARDGTVLDVEYIEDAFRPD
jgi:putative endonuclease